MAKKSLEVMKSAEFDKFISHVKGPIITFLFRLVLIGFCTYVYCQNLPAFTSGLRFYPLDRAEFGLTPN